MPRTAPLALLGLLLLGSAPAQAPDVTLQVAKYDDLAALVRANRGKVVVVDCWAND
jgi:hypothetical protein